MENSIIYEDTELLTEEPEQADGTVCMTVSETDAGGNGWMSGFVNSWKGGHALLSRS